MACSRVRCVEAAVGIRITYSATSVAVLQFAGAERHDASPNEKRSRSEALIGRGTRRIFCVRCVWRRGARTGA